MTIGRGAENAYLSTDEVRQIVTQAFESGRLNGKRVIVLIPDATRTMPMPQMFALLQEILRPRVKVLDYLVALGTHTPMGDPPLSKLGVQPSSMARLARRTSSIISGQSQTRL